MPFFLRRDLAVCPYPSGRASVEPSPRSEETGYAGRRASAAALNGPNPGLPTPPPAGNNNSDAPF
nr:MAG TPA_asm: hypothetical protein [Caudoviricetes sp.]